MQCISVDLPDPDGPMTAVKLATFERDVYSVEGTDGDITRAVRLGQVLRPGCGGGGGCVEHGRDTEDQSGF